MNATHQPCRRLAGLSPGAAVAFAYLAAILLGGFLLSLPFASRPILAGEHPYQWRDHVLNCLFTAASAVTLTGLSVYRTGYDFTPAGQAILLGLMQAGGLTIMMLATLFAVRAARPIRRGDVVAVAAAVCVGTFVLEGLGAAVLHSMWTGADAARGGRWFWSVFHAVSAFCNGGLALSDDGLIPYRRCWQVYGAILPLMIVGGLGWPAIRGLGQAIAARGGAAGGDVQWALHGRIVLATTLALLVVAPVLLWVAETPTRWTKHYEVRMNSEVMVKASSDRMSALPARERWWAALFLAATPRTTGLQTVRTDESSLSGATRCLLMVLMFIGGGPASTAGGVKVVAFAVLLLAVRAALRGDREIRVWGRTIPWECARHAFVVTSLMAGMIVAAACLLGYFESHPLSALLFEAASASSNAGLSTGITPNLTKFGRIVLMLCMLAGRIGPVILIARMTVPLPADLPIPDDDRKTLVLA